MNKNRFNAIKKIGIVACAAFSMTGVVFATTQIINKFGKNSSDGVQTAINNAYYSDVNTEYKEANGISANIESFWGNTKNCGQNLYICMNLRVRFEPLSPHIL